MRITELAKQLEVTPRYLLRQAQSMGVEARTLLSTLDSEDIELISEGLKRRLSIEIADEESGIRALMSEKAAAAAELSAAGRGSEEAALRGAIARAREIEERISLARGEVSAESVAREDSAEVAEPASAAPDAAVAVAPDAAAEVASEPEAEASPVAEAKPAAPAAARPRTPPRAFDPDDEDDEDYALPGGRRKFKDEERVRPSRKRDLEKDVPEKELRKPAEVAKTPAAEEQEEAPAPMVQLMGAGSKVLQFQGAVVVKELASQLGVRPNVVIAGLMKLGVLASINQSVDATTASKIAQQHGFVVERDRPRRKQEHHQPLRRDDADDDIPEDTPEDLLPRPPVVTFLGHVDHGKTSLMDRIRSTSVTQGESGGITQHVGAYTIEVNGQVITFLDTPGHAAFSSMRARGASLMDIAVIIIAADDGIMPQTREAIQHARNADVSIMVAINKCDLPQANPDRVMQQLQAENLTPEDWGGDVVVCQVSAATGEGMDNLLEMIQLQADILELRANPNRRANGAVIEAQMEPGRGPLASVLVTGGTLKVGDAVLCGEYFGRLRGIMNAQGKLIKKATPSMAVKIMGLSGVPEAGAEFRVLPNERRARQLAAEYAEERKEETLGVTQARSVDDIFRKMHDDAKLELSIILRADMQGSIEAIEDSLKDFKSDKVSYNVIQSGTGNITSNDVRRAASASAVIVGFHTSPESGVNAEARHFGVRIRTFRIIYELLDFIKQEMLSLLPVEHKEVVRGRADIRQVFSLTRKGNVAGCVVTQGSMLIAGKARVTRKKEVLYTGSFSSIRHFRDEVKEVSAGQECGLRFTNFENFQEGDVVECFVLEELPKAL